MSKANFKNLIKETRRSLKISNFEKKQVYGCMDKVIEFLRSSPVNESQAKLCSSFLSNFMHLLKSVVKEHKIIEDDDEEKYGDKLSSLLCFYIDAEVKRMRLNSKDQSKSNIEKNFIDKISAKCRVYDESSKTLAVQSLGKFFAQNDFRDTFDDLELGGSLRLAFSKLLKKIVNLRVTAIKSTSLPYFYQILVVWLKISDDEKTKDRIEKFAMDHSLSVGSLENGRSESQKVLQQTQCESCERNDKKKDAFDSLKDEGYLIDGVAWLSQLDKIPYSLNATVDLTEDSDDSDIEVELPPPVELIEVDDDEQEASQTSLNIPSISSRTSLPTTPRICIQERKSYISSVTSLNDTERPLSFLALRRKSIMMLEEEKRKRRKSVDERSLVNKTRVRSRAKTVDVKSKTNFRSPKIVKDMRECHVALEKISSLEIEKFKRGKLKISYFLNKCGKVSRSHRKRYKVEKEKAKRIKLDTSPQKSQVAKKSASPNDHTKSNLSLLQVLGKDIIEKSASEISIKKRQRSSRIARGSDSFEVLRSSDDKSIRIVNVDQDDLEWPLSDHQYAHSPWIDPAPNIEGNSLDVTSNIQPAENFENESESEQTGANTDLLEELLGSRASAYLPDVTASMNNSRVSNVSTAEACEETPKKRKYNKRSEPKIVERKELPKRERKKRNLDL